MAERSVVRPSTNSPYAGSTASTGSLKKAGREERVWARAAAAQHRVRANTSVVSRRTQPPGSKVSVVPQLTRPAAVRVQSRSLSDLGMHCGKLQAAALGTLQ